MLSSLLSSVQLNQLHIPDRFWPTNSKKGVIGISSAATVVTLLTILYRRSKRAKDGPMVPYTWPFIGSTPEYRKDPQTFVEKWTKELGPVFRAYLFGNIVTVATGQYARQVFLNEDFNFLVSLNRIFNIQSLAGCCSEKVIKPDQTALIVKKYVNAKMDGYTERVIKHIQEAEQDILGELKEPKEIAHVYVLIQHIVAKASASVFVGTEICQDPGLIDTFKNVVIEVGSEIRPRAWLEPFPSINVFRMWFIGKASPRVRKHRRQLYNALEPVVRDRLEQMKNNPDWNRPEDVLQDIMENCQCPKGMDYVRYLVDWILILIFAAVHTTSENTTIFIYRLLQNPHVMDDLLEEQRQVLTSLGKPLDGPDEQVFTRSTVKMFEKLDSFCRECFRLQNDFLGLSHIYNGKRDFLLGDKCVVHPGEEVYVNLWTTHRAADIQRVGTNNDLHEFQPFRFVNQNKQATKVGEDFLPFGMGRHACPGRFFAMNEAKLIISILLRKYKLKPLEAPVFPIADRIKMPYGKFTIEKRLN